eukprot:m.15310 g.15310  ORF g.15310 m.15310 type:complete len:68 (+) comp24814_c0_seq2:1400-1603(+)
MSLTLARLFSRDPSAKRCALSLSSCLISASTRACPSALEIESDCPRIYRISLLSTHAWFSEREGFFD